MRKKKELTNKEKKDLVNRYQTALLKGKKFSTKNELEAEYIYGFLQPSLEQYSEAGETKVLKKIGNKEVEILKGSKEWNELFGQEEDDFENEMGKDIKLIKFAMFTCFGIALILILLDLITWAILFLAIAFYLIYQIYRKNKVNKFIEQTVKDFRNIEDLSPEEFNKKFNEVKKKGTKSTSYSVSITDPETGETNTSLFSSKKDADRFIKKQANLLKGKKNEAK